MNAPVTPRPEIAAERRPAPRLGVLALIGVVCLALVALDGRNIWNAREEALQHAGETTANLAGAIAQHAEDAVRGAEGMLLGLVDRLETDGTDAAALDRLRRLLRARGAALPQLKAIAAIGEDGRMVASSLGEPAGASYADRDYFQYHRSHDDRLLRIGMPVQGRSTGEWVIPVSRRVAHRDGSFAGVALATIDIGYFRRFYDTFSIGQMGLVGLTTTDGILLARRPFDAAAIGRDLSQGAVFRDRLRQGPSGTVEYRSMVDGQERINSFRRVDAYGLVATVALAKDEVLAQWRRDAWRDVAYLVALLGIVALIGQRTLRHATLRAVAQRALTESRARLQAFLDNVPAAINLKDSSHRFVMLNKQYEAWFGVTREQQLGRRLADVGTEPEFAALMERVEDEVIATGESRVSEFREPDIGTAPQWVLSTKFPVRLADGSIVGVGTAIVDITERRHAEDALRESEQRYRLLADNLTDIILLTELGSWKRLYVSPSCRAMLGYAPEEVLAIAAAELIHPDDVEQFHAMRASLGPANEEATATYRLRRRDGQHIWVENRMRFVAAADGQPARFVSTLRNVTARREAEDALQEAKDAAEEANRAKSIFLASMSHEIRTPMNGIIGFAELLLDAPLAAAERGRATLIRDAAQSLLAIINDILDVSKIDAGKLALETIAVSPQAVVAGAVAIVRREAEAKGIALGTALAADLPAWVRSDPTRLRQVLLNLLSNAVKFTARAPSPSRSRASRRRTGRRGCASPSATPAAASRPTACTSSSRTSRRSTARRRGAMAGPGSALPSASASPRRWAARSASTACPAGAAPSGSPSRRARRRRRRSSRTPCARRRRRAPASSSPTTSS